jgi:hypothetical protein
MSETNDNFEEVQQLLKIKRHEIPPPGYFNGFSGDVISRIQAGEAGGGETFFERLQSNSAFWASARHIFSIRPGIIGGVATSMCALFLFGVMLLDRSESGQALADTFSAQSAPPGSENGPALMASAAPLEAPAGGLTVSTNPISSLQPVSALFNSPQNPLFEPVNYVPASQ